LSRQFFPEIDTLDGDLALDVDLKGTVGQPMLSGAGDMTINLGRFHDPVFPTMQDFKARITFAQNAFTFERVWRRAGGRSFYDDRPRYFSQVNFGDSRSAIERRQRAGGRAMTM